MNNYLKAFDKLKKEGNDLFELIGENLIVEKISQEDIKSNGGIILSAPSNHRGTMQDSLPMFVRVLMTGSGYYNEETKEDIPLDTKPGDILLIADHAFKEIAALGDVLFYGKTQVGICRESSIHMRFKGQDCFEKSLELLKDSK